MSNDIRCLETEEIDISCSLLNKRQIKFSPRSLFGEFLYNTWQKINKTFLADRNELQVWQKVDRHGNIYWNAYDPATGKSFSSGSQADIYMWIEQLYHVRLNTYDICGGR
ncbi:hypothetical protein JYQ62_11535 [Nostoc sp. UHCC 0702]|nr:hypothetical protein JYQ62_11535 [Nostoc sp. UHCC 0702]